MPFSDLCHLETAWKRAETQVRIGRQACVRCAGPVRQRSPARQRSPPRWRASSEPDESLSSASSPLGPLDFVASHGRGQRWCRWKLPQRRRGWCRGRRSQSQPLQQEREQDDIAEEAYQKPKAVEFCLKDQVSGRSEWPKWSSRRALRPCESSRKDRNRAYRSVSPSKRRRPRAQPASRPEPAVLSIHWQPSLPYIDLYIDIINA